VGHRVRGSYEVGKKARNAGSVNADCKITLRNAQLVVGYQKAERRRLRLR
jgi:hypothetical protein